MPHVFIVFITRTHSTNKLLYNEDGEPEFRQTTEQSADVLRSQDLILQLIEEVQWVLLFVRVLSNVVMTNIQTKRRPTA